MTQLGNDLISALREALAHVEGDASGIGDTHEVDLARDLVDVRAIRKSIGLKQEQMARIMDLSVSGYRKWEQGRRAVSGPARSLLVVMQKEPLAVLRALGSSPAPKDWRPGRTGEAARQTRRARKQVSA